MADETGMIGFGSTVRIGRGETPNWTELALVGDIDMPDEQIDEIETTHMKSPGRRKQFISGMTDGGEVSIPMNYIPGSASDLLLQEIKASGEVVLIEITLTADGTPETFAGFLKGYARTAPVGDKMTCEATFRLSEEVTP
ncbi:phage tail tube protein [Thioclava kandeliae]|uniref:Phage tail tube protein n=1 Tax=Thioclava kandeliae TaxID=3070818 RepID=A0ABV1SFD5_9RHOB